MALKKCDADLLERLLSSGNLLRPVVVSIPGIASLCSFLRSLASIAHSSTLDRHDRLP